MLCEIRIDGREEEDYLESEYRAEEKFLRVEFISI